MLASPAYAGIENRCWLQTIHTPGTTDPTTAFILTLNGVRGTGQVPMSIDTVPAGTGDCPAGGNDCNKYCADLDVTRPYSWDVTAQGSTGLETVSTNGPQDELVLPPSQPILLGFPSP